MPRKIWQEEAPAAACCLLAFCIPLPFIFATLCIWLLAICWLLSGSFKETGQVLKQTKAYWLWALYFLMHAASWFWSRDKGQSEFDTVAKLSYLLLPLLAGAGTRLDVRKGGWVALAFIAGMVAAGIFCLDQANTRWQEDDDINHFFYHELSRGLDANAVYMAWYIVGAQAALLLYPWRAAGMGRMLWWRWLLLLFFTGLLLLFASRLMILCFLLIVIPAFGMRFFVQRRRSVLILLAALVIGSGSLVILARTGNPVHRRFADIMHPDLSTVTKDNYRGKEPAWTNLTLRLFVWRIAYENMNAHHLWLYGAGNGDVHEIQNARIASHGIPNMTEASMPRSSLYKVNLHNMFFQSLIMFGIAGFIVFLLIALAPFFYLHRAALPWFYGVFHLISLLFMLQESALQTQAGVIYYCFFNAIFWSGVKRREKRVEKAVVKR